MLFFSEVKVENTVAGSALLYRLFESLDPQSMLIYEFDVLKHSKHERKLNGVQYHYLRALSFLQANRFSKRVHVLLSLCIIPLVVIYLKRKIRNQPLTNIVTVTHGIGWLIAYKLSKKLNIPLILILHDEVSFTYRVPGFCQQFMISSFASCYRSAKKRFCVSPYMEEYYFHKFGVRGDVLYPFRSSTSIEYKSIPVRVRQAKQSIVFGYAGSIATPSYGRQLALLANALNDKGGKLIIFSSIDIAFMRRHGLLFNNVEIKSFLPTNDLVSYFRQNVDALFVPMAFDQETDVAFQLNFPSKLTDYTLAGLPLVISGPSNSSAIKWARDNTEVAITIGKESLNEFTVCIDRLLMDAELRIQLAEKSLNIGNHYFSFAKNSRLFENIFL